MAVYTGKAMVVTFGVALTHVRSAKVSPSIDQVEITAAADTAKTYVTTTTGFDCSVEMLHDDTAELFDTELAVGTSGTFILQPEGTGAGTVKISGTAIVTAFEFSSSYDSPVAATVKWIGNGALTVGTT